jgi:hypothetical protein
MGRIFRGADTAAHTREEFGDREGRGVALSLCQRKLTSIQHEAEGL